MEGFPGFDVATVKKRSEGEIGEKMQENRIEEIKRRARNRKGAIKQKAETEARQEELEDQFRRASPTLGEELKSREPTFADLERLCPEERSLVHAPRQRQPGSGPMNRLALRTEVFRNNLRRIDYLMLAAVPVPPPEE
jgi:hypothetical protein